MTRLLNRIAVLAVVLLYFSISQSVFAQDGETILVGGSVRGKFGAEPAEIVYPLDIPAGELVTLTVAGEFIRGATSASISYQIQDADGNIINFIPFIYRGFRASGALPYTLHMNGYNTSYMVTLEAGDTLERVSLGALAAGQRIEGLLPDVSDTYHTIQLNVEAGKTYTVQQWEAAEVRFIIVDGELVQVLPNDPPATNSLTFEVAEGNTPPLYLIVESAVDNSGKPFVFTLAEGETALSPEQAQLATSGDTTQTAAPETTPEATEAPTVATCTITSSGESRQRVGPGTNYELTGLMAPGATANVDGQARGTDGLTWWRLGEGFWVRSDLVDEVGDCESVPVVPAP